MGPLRKRNLGRRLRRWLGQLCNDGCTNFVGLVATFSVCKTSNGWGKVLIGQMRKLNRDQLAISLGTPSF
jgi:hypothetical protein